MLTNDTQTLEEVKIDTDNVIIHLFPKPRVVVTRNDSTASGGNDDGATLSSSASIRSGQHGNDTPGGGAHIPSIVIDQEEQERRGQILVLGSVEIAESQNNIKMLSLLLLVICSMRLLALFSIAMGVAEEPVGTAGTTTNGGDGNSTLQPRHNPNDGNSYNNDQEMEIREWRTSDYFDLAVR
jgi:hypothetical protein